MKSIEEEAKELVDRFLPLTYYGAHTEQAKSAVILHIDLMIETLKKYLELTIDEPLIENRINHYTLLKEAVGKI